MSVSKEIINVLDALTEKFGIAVDWSAENIIPYFEQLCGKYITYEIATSILWIVVCIAICISGIIGFKWLQKHQDFGVTKYEYLSDDYCLRVMAYIGVCCLLLLGVLLAVAEIKDIITALTFPEKLILKEIKNLYTSMK